MNTILVIRDIYRALAFLLKLVLRSARSIAAHVRRWLHRGQRVEIAAN